MVGGILIALGGSLPISPYVTTISFAIYVVCRIVGTRRVRRGWAPRAAALAPPDADSASDLTQGGPSAARTALLSALYC